ncbi:hypothetical protein CEXT_567811 [Caerostris extrusa]|uniref:Uncharacterized protein n=1 Tax=Caerostris extrusa TaxID=172846 RepID=A0AAV4TUD2_CAEEX|nr:hypothetical protein CEXT_567811 [Caerostris extrusa]
MVITSRNPPGPTRSTENKTKERSSNLSSSAPCSASSSLFRVDDIIELAGMSQKFILETLLVGENALGESGVLFADCQISKAPVNNVLIRRRQQLFGMALHCCSFSTRTESRMNSGKRE